MPPDFRCAFVRMFPVVQKILYVFGRTDVDQGHRHKLLARETIGSDGGVVYLKEGKRLQVIDPHWVWAIHEGHSECFQFPKFLFLLRRAIEPVPNHVIIIDKWLSSLCDGDHMLERFSTFECPW